VKNKVVIITGASSGIGKALAYELSSFGSKVVLGARNIESLAKIANDIKQKGGDAIFVETDVSIEADCKNLIDEAINKYGGVDVLINNAGISMRALFENTDLSVIKKLMDVNFWGTVYCTKYALPHVLKQKGSIVGVSSIAGIKALPARTGYSASKYAMVGFLEALRVENSHNEIHILIAYPGFTASNIRNTSLGADGSPQGESPRNEDQMMKAEEVARHIYYAIKKRKDKIILTGQGKLIFQINKFVPAMLDKMIYKGLAKEPNSPFK
jgi:short-subunit dehydrogenase